MMTSLPAANLRPADLWTRHKHRRFYFILVIIIIIITNRNSTVIIIIILSSSAKTAAYVRTIVNAPLLKSLFRPSVRPSVRLFMTRVSCELSIRELFAEYILLGQKSGKNLVKIFATTIPQRLLCGMSMEKSRLSTNISLYLRKIKDLAIVTMLSIEWCHLK